MHYALTLLTDDAYPPFQLGPEHRPQNLETFNNNLLTTYKWTWITFVPGVLWEQLSGVVVSSGGAFAQQSLV